MDSIKISQMETESGTIGPSDSLYFVKKDSGFESKKARYSEIYENIKNNVVENPVFFNYMFENAKTEYDKMNDMTFIRFDVGITHLQGGVSFTASGVDYSIVFSGDSLPNYIQIDGQQLSQQQRKILETSKVIKLEAGHTILVTGSTAHYGYANPIGKPNRQP